MTEIGPYGFSGGICSRADNFTCPKNSMLDCKNMQLSGASLIERNGCVLISSGAGLSSSQKNCQLLCPDLTFSGTIGPIGGLAIYSGVTYQFGFNPGSFTRIDGGSAIFNPGSSISYATADCLNSIMYLGDPSLTGTLGKWTGSGSITALSVSNAPSGRNLVLVVNNFLFVAGGGDSNVVWSNVGDGTTWTSANFLSFRLGDGDAVVGLSYIGTTLYIFKRRSIGSLSTYTSINSGVATLGPLSTVITNRGALYYGCVDRLPDGRIVFLGSDFHAYIFDGNTFTDISDQPFPYPNVQNIFNTCALVFNVRVCCYPLRNQVWFAFSPNSNDGANKMVLVYDYVNNCWVRYSTSGNFQVLAYLPTPDNFSGTSAFTFIGCLFSGQAMTGSLGGSNPGGTLYAEDVPGGEDQSGNIDCSYTKSIPYTTDAREFEPRSMIHYIQNGPSGASGTINFSVGYDGGTTQVAKAQASLSASAIKRVTTPINVSVSNSSVQVVVDNAVANGVTYDAIMLSDEVII